MTEDTSAATSAQPSAPHLTGLNKRQQVVRANKNIFLAVAVAAAVVTLSVVTMQFLLREALFNREIIAKKQEASDTLKKNLENIKTLKTNINNLAADTNLASAKTADSSSALQVIPDALPTTGDATTFSNSLYNKILSRSGVTISAVSVGTEALPGAAPATVVSTEQDPKPTALSFSVTLSGDAKKLTTALTDMERTIRPIILNHVIFTASDSSLDSTLVGDSYFLSSSSVELGKQLVQPPGKR